MEDILPKISGDILEEISQYAQIPDITNFIYTSKYLYTVFGEDHNIWKKLFKKRYPRSRYRKLPMLDYRIILRYMDDYLYNSKTYIMPYKKLPTVMLKYYLYTDFYAEDKKKFFGQIKKDYANPSKYAIGISIDIINHTSSLRFIMSYTRHMFSLHPKYKVDFQSILEAAKLSRWDILIYFFEIMSSVSLKHKQCTYDILKMKNHFDWNTIPLDVMFKILKYNDLPPGGTYYDLYKILSSFAGYHSFQVYKQFIDRFNIDYHSHNFIYYWICASLHRDTDTFDYFFDKLSSPIVKKLYQYLLSNTSIKNREKIVFRLCHHPGLLGYYQKYINIDSHIDSEVYNRWVITKENAMNEYYKLKELNPDRFKVGYWVVIADGRGLIGENMGHLDAMELRGKVPEACVLIRVGYENDPIEV